MPAVLCEIGPPPVVVEHTGELARTLTLALQPVGRVTGGALTCAFYPQLLPQDVDNVNGRFTRRPIRRRIEG